MLIYKILVLIAKNPVVFVGSENSAININVCTNYRQMKAYQSNKTQLNDEKENIDNENVKIITEKANQNQIQERV